MNSGSPGVKLENAEVKRAFCHLEAAGTSAYDGGSCGGVSAAS